MLGNERSDIHCGKGGFDSRCFPTCHQVTGVMEVLVSPLGMRTSNPTRNGRNSKVLKLLQLRLVKARGPPRDALTHGGRSNCYDRMTRRRNSSALVPPPPPAL